MQLLEAERLKTLEEQELTHHQEVESDAVIQSLDSELQALIKVMFSWPGVGRGGTIIISTVET